MLSKLRIFLEVIKFEHTVFALPFAYLGMIVATRRWPNFSVFFWATVAMASARTTGMLLNRLIDLRLDEKNPRTKSRALITGEISIQEAWAGVGVSAALFFLSAFLLNPLCLRLAPVALFLLSTYHYVKRFSFLCHFSLGLVLSIAPVGGWVAVTDGFSWVVLPLAAAVLLWVAGFDIIYSLQDLDFDRANRLHSIPVQFGQETALRISAYCHLGVAVLLILFAVVAHLGVIFLAGVAITAILLKVEHSIIFSGDLSRINAAFFTINGWIGILLLIFAFLEIFR